MEEKSRTRAHGLRMSSSFRTFSDVCFSIFPPRKGRRRRGREERRGKLESVMKGDASSSTHSRSLILIPSLAKGREGEKRRGIIGRVGERRFVHS